MEKINLGNGTQGSGDDGFTGAGKINDNYVALVAAAFGQTLWDSADTETIDLSGLQTNNKTSLLAAINEVNARANVIDDSLATSLFKTWSIDKLNAELLKLSDKKIHYLKEDFDWTVIGVEYADSHLIVRDDFDLSGATITLPSGSILNFKGGKLLNGTIQGSNSMIIADQYQVFDLTTSLTGTWKVQEFKPQWFGAKADGSTNDTTALQKTIDEVESIGGGVIRMPIGTYNINGVQLKSDVSLKSLSTNTKIFLINSSDGPVLYGNGVSNVTVDGIYIDGNKANQGPPPQGEYWDCVSFRGANGDHTGTASENVLVKNCEMINSPAQGVRFIGTVDSTIFNNKISLSADDNIAVENGCSKNIIAYNHLKDSTATGNTGIGSQIELEGGALDTTIIGNIGFGGVVGITLDVDTGADSVERTTIIGNTFRGQTNNGILIAGDANKVKSSLIANNNFYNSQLAGIQIQDASDVSLTGNHFYQCGATISTSDGVILIQRDVNGCSIHGNYVIGSPSRGIYIKNDDTYAISVRNNTVRDALANGIRCEATRVMIEGNNIYDCSDTGIVVKGNDCRVYNNFIYKINSTTANYGIGLSANPSGLRIQNNYIEQVLISDYTGTGTRCVINGIATDSGNAETPTATYYEPGESVDWTDTGDGSGDGLYTLMQDGTTWKKVA